MTTASLKRQKQQSRYATFVEMPEQLDESGNPLEPRPDDDRAIWASTPDWNCDCRPLGSH
jgi:hypothetical protein